MELLFINPNLAKPTIAPVGLEYITEHLIREGHQVSLINIPYNIEINKEELSHYELIGIAIRNIDNTGFRPIEFYLPKIKDLVKRLKEKVNSPIVIGGSAVNLMPEEIRKFVEADYAVVGKGFKSIEELITQLKKGHVNKHIIENKTDFVKGYFKRDVISHVEYQKNGTSIGVTTKFGCPFNCSYCDYPVVDGSKLRKRDPKEIKFEIESLKKQGIINIFFTDANFNIDANHGTEILNELNRKNIKINWEAFLNPHSNAFTKPFFNEIVKSGKKTVAFGVDSLSEKGLLYLNKGFTIEDIYNSTLTCQSKNIKVNYSILLGHPDETEKDILEAFKNIDKLKPSYVDVVVGIRLYPKTPIYYECLKRGIITKDQDLIKPYYIPIKKRIESLIIKETIKRPNCHLSNQESLNMYKD
ncbi:MAG: radical SAM protein [Candidatus Woesearchaeota archaeon]